MPNLSAPPDGGPDFLCIPHGYHDLMEIGEIVGIAYPRLRAKLSAKCSHRLTGSSQTEFLHCVRRSLQSASSRNRPGRRVFPSKRPAEWQFASGSREIAQGRGSGGSAQA